SVWLRHLTVLGSVGFDIRGARIGELGPGDSLGTGLTAVLTGARTYVALDVVPFYLKTDLSLVFRELLRMFSSCEPIPGGDEFPEIYPTLPSYSFPYGLVDRADVQAKADGIWDEVLLQPGARRVISCRVPWNSADVIERNSLDLIFSQAALEHVDE